MQCPTWRVVWPWGIAAAAGVIAWAAWLPVQPLAPVWLRTAVAFLMLVAGPGLVAARPFTRTADRLEQTVAPLGAGLVAAATLAHLLALAGWWPAFPWLAAGLTGLGTLGAIEDLRLGHGPGRGAIVGAAFVAVLAASVGAAAYAKRLDVTPRATIINGSYDSYDSSYYAAMSAELARHVPPASPFHAGHGLTYSYHPQLLLAMVHRFGGVGLIDLYFRYGWPTFLLMMALTTFVFVRRIASCGQAVLATCLLLLGSDFSYIAAVFWRGLPHWDDLLWSANWLTPGAELLYFNPWSPALCVLFLGLWALVDAERTGQRLGLLATAICFGSLVQFKPFAFASAMCALAATLVVGRFDSVARRRLGAVLAGGLVVGLAQLASALLHYQDSQAVIAFGVGYVEVLPQILTAQTGLRDALAAFTVAGARPSPLSLAVTANVLFFVGGVGARLVGVAGVWRSLRGGPIAWSLIAWMVVAGTASPLLFVSHPYHQTFQPFQLSLFLLWIFAANAVLGSAGHRRHVRGLLMVALFVCATPSTLHYLHVKLHDDRHPFAAIDEDVLAVVECLRREDPERTVLIKHHPDAPSFAGLLAERRTVLAWARYARDSKALRADVDAFFAGSSSPHDAWALLGRYRVTHVLEVARDDRIHPEVLGALRPLLVTATYRLYAVPDWWAPDGTSPNVGPCTPAASTAVHVESP